MSGHTNRIWSLANNSADSQPKNIWFERKKKKSDLPAVWTQANPQKGQNKLYKFV